MFSVIIHYICVHGYVVYFTIKVSFLLLYPRISFDSTTIPTTFLWKAKKLGLWKDLLITNMIIYENTFTFKEFCIVTAYCAKQHTYMYIHRYKQINNLKYEKQTASTLRVICSVHFFFHCLWSIVRLKSEV